MIRELEEIIADEGNKRGYAFSVATPSRENFEADSYVDKKVLWYDIQQDGSFLLGEDGLQLETHVKLHFMDDHAWDAEDESANIRKNVILSDAFDTLVSVNARIGDASFEMTSSPTWQVLYCQFDQNKIDVAVDFRVRSTKIRFC